MAYNSWIDTEAPIYINDGFNALIVNDTNYNNLTEFLLRNPSFSSLWTNISDWLNSILYFPCDLNQVYNNYITPNYVFSYGGFSEQYMPGRTEGMYVTCKKPLCTSKVYNLGSFHYTPYSNDFTDYNGFTRLMLWLPYLGFVNINPNDVINKYIRIRLKIDIFSGEGIYYITTSDHPAEDPTTTKILDLDIYDNNSRIIATYKCRIGFSIPIGRSNSSELTRNALLAGLNIAGYAAGLNAPPRLTSVSYSHTEDNSAVYRRNPKTHRKYLFGSKQDESEASRESYSMSHVDANNCFDVASDTLSLMHGNVTAGVVDDVLNMMNASQRIRLIRFRPKYIETDSQYNHIYGKPNGTIQKLGEIWGYTEISSVHIEGANLATISGEELSLLENEIKSGIILPSADFTLDDSLTLQFTAGGKQTWKNWINSGGDASQIFADTHFDYDAQKVYVTILNVRYHLESGGNIVRYFDDIKSQNYDIVEEI